MKFATILQNMDKHEVANWICDSNFEFTKHFITTVFKEYKIEDKDIEKITSILDSKNLRKNVIASILQTLDTEYTFMYKQKESEKNE